VSKELNKINPGPFGSQVRNFAAVKGDGKLGNDVAGVKDFTNPKLQPIDGNTMLGEGSIGKVRFAGLAYMLQEEKIIDLKQNAAKFFARPEMKDFLEKKYPGKSAELQSEIAKFFSGDSASASLSDLTTHMAGVGDLTRDQARLFADKGVAHDYSLPELLLLAEPYKKNSGKPRAQAGADVVDEKLPSAEYGKHQYSNLGYMLLGVAMEAAYAEKNPQAKLKDYKQLTRDFMLNPIEGRAFRHNQSTAAAGSVINFQNTKFPHEITADDNVARSSWFEKGKIVDAVQFGGANAAGGMFASADDSKKFFTEFFRGFPGTPEYGEEVNKFFSKDTIELMKQEWKRQQIPANQTEIDEKIAAGEKAPNRRFQGPGFNVDVDENQQVVSYSKGGGTIGYASMLQFDAGTNNVTIDMCAQENVSHAIAQKIGRDVSEIVNDKGGIVGVGSKPAAAVEVDAKPVVGSHTARLAAKRESRSSTQNNVKQ